MVAAWAKQPAAVDYLKTLPVRGACERHHPPRPPADPAVRTPDSTAVLQALWKDALASPYAPDLLALVLRRLPPTVQAELPVAAADRLAGPRDRGADEPAGPARPREAPVAAKGEEKLTPDLRARLAGGGDAATPLRLEVILALTPDESDRAWRRDLSAAARASSSRGASARWSR